MSTYKYRNIAVAALLTLVVCFSRGGVLDKPTPTFAEPTVPVILDLGGFDRGTGAVATAISADGKTVVGVSEHPNYSPVAFRWTLETGMISLDQSFLIRRKAIAFGVSADGSVIVGEQGDTAFVWTKKRGLVSLGKPADDPFSSATSVSPDGKAIAGRTGDHAFVWTEHDGMKVLSGEEIESVAAVMDAGKYVFATAGWGREAWRVGRWDKEGNFTKYVVPTGWEAGVLIAGRLPRNDGEKAAFRKNVLMPVFRAATPDGTVVIGEMIWTDNGTAFSKSVMWTSPTSVTLLPDSLNGGSMLAARAISADGKVVVGTASDGAHGNRGTAFRWTRETGIQSISDWIKSAGGQEPTSFPADAVGVSADGRRIIGTLENGNPFIAIVPAP
jgi:probable HAF family extracellular repeat protein